MEPNVLIQLRILTNADHWPVSMLFFLCLILPPPLLPPPSVVVLYTMYTDVRIGSCLHVTGLLLPSLYPFIHLGWKRNSAATRLTEHSASLKKVSSYSLVKIKTWLQNDFFMKLSLQFILLLSCLFFLNLKRWRGFTLMLNGAFQIGVRIEASSS